MVLLLLLLHASRCYSFLLKFFASQLRLLSLITYKQRAETILTRVIRTTCLNWRVLTLLTLTSDSRVYAGVVFRIFCWLWCYSKDFARTALVISVGSLEANWVLCRSICCESYLSCDIFDSIQCTTTTWWGLLASLALLAKRSSL